jgi:hypothetical protein
MSYTVSELKAIITEAQEAAYAAADAFENKYFPDGGWGACGFAWVNIYRHNDVQIKGNTKIGRALKQAGVTQDWTRVFSIWNPSKYPTQNIDTLEAGARAAAKVLERYGFTAYAGSRLD